jgi:hypothetical protein
VLAGLVLLIAFALVEAVTSTFFASYWTIAYRQMERTETVWPSLPRPAGGPIAVAPPRPG